MTSQSVSANETVSRLSFPLPPKPLPPKRMAQNPYMPQSDSCVHNDWYSSDVTDAVAPLGIYPELNAARETELEKSPSVVFFDEHNRAFTPYARGVAVRDVDAATISMSACYLPEKGDDSTLLIAYSFIDASGCVVGPTTDGRVLALRIRQGVGGAPPIFQKTLDVDVVKAAKAALGEDIFTKLLSVVYDYQGNLWFVTGGYRVYPDRNPAGFLGFLSRSYIDRALAGESPDLAGQIFFHRLDLGENAENGISSSLFGAVVLTNRACYTLKAGPNGVETVWRTPYDSCGAREPAEGSRITGGGLAWGGGSTPSLTDDLVLFTDNLDPINLLALSARTGDVVASSRTMDFLPEGCGVSVENSIIVYTGDNVRTTVLLCNWFGAGSPMLSDPGVDSSTPSYENLYDKNWVCYGNAYIEPGVERIDIVREGDAYHAERVWARDDLRDTSMIKLSTASGYFYGYVQNLETGMWVFIALDFDTGKTVMEIPVSDDPKYNNMAVGMICNRNGNALYCPTNTENLVRLQDRFVYLPDDPQRRVNLDVLERRMPTEKERAALAKHGCEPASYACTVPVSELRGATTLAVRLSGLTGRADGLTLFAWDAPGPPGALEPDKWRLTLPDGTPMKGGDRLSYGAVYEVRVGMPLAPTQSGAAVSMILAKKAE